jgi:hypothetical protein
VPRENFAADEVASEWLCPALSLKSVEIADLETRLVALEQVSAEERSMVRFDA